MNTLRASNGLPLLIEDPIVNAVAQAMAEYMAANNMSTHIGDVRGRIQAAGYGGGATVWATENFAVRREAGQPPPWSQDPVFQKGRFLNVFREDDKGTKPVQRFAGRIP